jgi:cardiolipin synthase
MDTTENQNKILWNLPNLLTACRIVLVPVFLVMVIQKKVLGSLAIFLLAGLTDVLDGFIARTWHLKTKIGTLLDPAADKLLLTTAFILLTIPSLSIPNFVPLWLTISVIGRDVVIALGSLIILLVRGQNDFSPTVLGKTSTVCQVGTILLVLLFNYLQTSPSLLSPFYYITLAATLLSGIHYAYLGLMILFFPQKKVRSI